MPRAFDPDEDEQRHFMPIDDAWRDWLLTYAEATALRDIINAQTN